MSFSKSKGWKKKRWKSDLHQPLKTQTAHTHRPTHSLIHLSHPQVYTYQQNPNPNIFTLSVFNATYLLCSAPDALSEPPHPLHHLIIRLCFIFNHLEFLRVQMMLFYPSFWIFSQLIIYCSSSFCFTCSHTNFTSCLVNVNIRLIHLSLHERQLTIAAISTFIHNGFTFAFWLSISFTFIALSFHPFACCDVKQHHSLWLLYFA